MEYKQLELFPSRERAANMSFDWWLADVQSTFYAYTEIELNCLYQNPTKKLLAINKWLGGEVNLKERYKLKQDPIQAVKDILKLILIYQFEEASQVDSLDVKDNWDEAIEETLLKWESFVLDIYGRAIDETLILDQGEYYGELDFPTDYQLRERAIKLDKIHKAPGLKPYCHIQPKALLGE